MHSKKSGFSKKIIVIILLAIVVAGVAIFLTIRSNPQLFNIDFQSKSLITNKISGAVSPNLLANIILNPFR